MRWLSLALRDMDGIAAYILAEADGDTAQEVVARIFLASRSLATAPNRGRVGRVPHTRELVLEHLPYFLAYRVRGSEVQILRVIHASRNYP